MAKTKLLTKEETMKLIVAAQGGDEEALEVLCEKNSRLVWSMTYRFKDRGYELEDLYQIGCIGLIKSIHKFDLSFDVHFSTYATPMIIGEIQRFLRDDGIIKVSRSLKEIARKIKMEELQDVPVSELAKKFDVSVDIIRATFEYINDNKGEEGLAVALDKPFFQGNNAAGDKELTFADTIQGDINDNWLDSIMLKEILSQLEGRDAIIVEQRYFQDQTQAEVAKNLGISQVQVSRLEKKILRKLKGFFDGQQTPVAPVAELPYVAPRPYKGKGDRDKAIELLSTTTLTIQQVADAAGTSFATAARLAQVHRKKAIRTHGANRLKRA